MAWLTTLATLVIALKCCHDAKLLASHAVYPTAQETLVSTLAQHEAEVKALQANDDQRVARLAADHREQLAAAAVAAEAKLADAQVRTCRNP